MNKEHVEFALGQWAKKQGYVVVSFFERESHDIYGGLIGVHWRDKKTNEDGFHRPVIDYDFCRDLPVDNTNEYIYCCANFVNAGENVPEVHSDEYYLLMMRLTVEQRLEAYYKAFND